MIKNLIGGVLETYCDPFERMDFSAMEEAELDVKEIESPQFVYIPENKYTVINGDDENPDLVTSHVNDCVVVTIHGDNLMEWLM